MNRLVLFTTVLGLAGCGQRVPLETPRPPANYPQLLTLTADRRTVHPGEVVLLRWQSRDASSVTIEQAIDPHAHARANFQSLGSHPASGTLEVRPKHSTTYVVSCGDERIGCSSASIYIVVK